MKGQRTSNNICTLATHSYMSPVVSACKQLQIHCIATDCLLTPLTPLTFLYQPSWPFLHSCGHGLEECCVEIVTKSQHRQCDYDGNPDIRMLTSVTMAASDPVSGETFSYVLVDVVLVCPTSWASNHKQPDSAHFVVSLVRQGVQFRVTKKVNPHPAFSYCVLVRVLVLVLVW